LPELCTANVLIIAFVFSAVTAGISHAAPQDAAQQLPVPGLRWPAGRGARV